MLLNRIWYIFFLLTCSSEHFSVFEDTVYIFPHSHFAKTRDEANKNCLKYDSSLISINNKETQYYIARKLTIIFEELSKNSSLSSVLGTITGGYMTSWSMWKWPNGRYFYHQGLHEPINGAYTAWLQTVGRREPDNLENTNCYQLVMSSIPTSSNISEMWRWVDQSCSDTSNTYYYICSRSLDDFMNISILQSKLEADKDSNLTFQIKVQSWGFPVAIHISLDSSLVYVFNNSIIEHSIRNVSRFNSGNFAITASYNDVTVETTINLKIRHMSPLKVYMIEEANNSEHLVECIGSGYPQPTLTWEFDNNFCYLAEEVDVSNYPTQYDVIDEVNSQFVRRRLIYRSKNTTSIGTMTCVASNSYTTLKESVSLGIARLENLLKLNLMTRLSEEHSMVNLRWSHDVQSKDDVILKHVEYKIRLVSSYMECSFADKTLYFPTDSLILSDLCWDVEYNISVISSINFCSVAQHTTTVKLQMTSSTTELGLMAAMVAILFLLIFSISVTMYYVHKFKSCGRKKMNISEGEPTDISNFTQETATVSAMGNGGSQRQHSTPSTPQFRSSLPRPPSRNTTMPVQQIAAENAYMVPSSETNGHHAGEYENVYNFAVDIDLSAERARYVSMKKPSLERTEITYSTIPTEK